MENIYIIWSEENRQYHSPKQFLPLLPSIVLLLSVRYTVELYLIKPLGLYLGIPPDRPNELNPLLGNHSKPSKLTKFTESFIRFIWYSFIWTFGLAVLWNKPWLWDINESWTDFGNDPVTLDVWFYGAFTMVYYSSACISQFTDVKRHDFWIMFVHHFTVVVLVIVIWIFKLHRIGCLAPFIHDFSDIVMELSKCLKYLKCPKWPEILFGVFAISWIVTRLIILPFWYMRTCLEDPRGVLKQASIYYIWNGLFLVLLFLHCFWTVMIFRIFITIIQKGTAEDVRSEEESDSKEELKDD